MPTNPTNIFDNPTGFAPTQPTRQPQTNPLTDLANLSPDELLVLRALIDDLLPVTELKHLNLQRESTIQYMQSRKLLNDVLADPDIPVNQKAQVNNSVQANLSQLDKMQRDAYTSERYKQIETLLVRYINEMPDTEAKKQFLDEYARRLGDLDL